MARLNRLPQIGNLPLIVLWEAEDAGILAIGAPRGEIGVLWSRQANPNAETLERARQALVAQGYRAALISAVPHAP